MSSIQSGRELKEKLLLTTDSDEVMRLMKELVVKQQQDLYFLNKQFTELSLLVDQLVDEMVKVVSTNGAVINKLSPILKQMSENKVKISKDNESM